MTNAEVVIIKRSQTKFANLDESRTKGDPMRKPQRPVPGVVISSWAIMHSSISSAEDNCSLPILVGKAEVSPKSCYAPITKLDKAIAPRPEVGIAGSIG